MFKEYLRRIKRIFQYAWYVIRRADHDWEYSFLLELMMMKMGWMEKTIRNGHLANREKYADSLKVARLLLKRIFEDNYYEMYKNYYPDRIKWEKQGKYWKMNLDGYSEPKDHIPVVIKHGSEPSNMATDLDYFCKVLKKRLFNWWD